MVNINEVKQTLDRVVNLHQAGDHIDLMVVAVGELHTLFGGNLIKSQLKMYRYNFDVIDAEFLFSVPFETDYDTDGDPLAPTQEQLDEHKMVIVFHFGSGGGFDYVGGCRMLDVFVRTNGKLIHTHLKPSDVKQIPSTEILEWVQKIDVAERALDKARMTR
jgi:hypothetical protein